jgi:hypothetical protein
MCWASRADAQVNTKAAGSQALFKKLLHRTLGLESVSTP